MKIYHLKHGPIFALTLVMAMPVVKTQTLKSELIASGLSAPLLAISPPGDATRLFIIEQTGKIRIHDGTQLLATPFIDLSTTVSCCDEEGLLGMAFHPQYASNGLFYVNYTTSSGGRRTVVRRFLVSADSNIADVGSGLTIIEIIQPFANHNGGMIGFGPTDGFLYIGMGDGGSFGDPGNRAQNGNSLLGKMLRIDVDNPDAGLNYAIPADNPFVGTTDTLPEIWAFGLRNPWRWSFDLETGDMFIADVGQNIIEEIDFQPASSIGGENYGWRLKEGTSCFEPPSGCESLTALTEPIVEYMHQFGRCSITGGFVYRGCEIADLAGTYFYADWCSQEIWSFRFDGITLSDSTNRTTELGLALNVTSFGQDGNGELYIIGNNQIHKIVSADQPQECESSGCCQGPTGNVDGDPAGLVDIADLTFLIDHLFISFPPLSCDQEGNIDGDPAGNIDISDLTFLIDHLFINFPPTSPCQ